MRPGGIKVPDTFSRNQTDNLVIDGYNVTQHGYTAGYVGVAGRYPIELRLDNAKLWIDEDAANGVVDDPADLVDQVFSDDFGSTDNEISHTYDAWNRLVQVRAGESDESVFATYRYDGTGRRIIKTVTASADFDRTEYCYYDGQRLIETRNASEQTIMQTVFGTQYIDEPIRLDVNTDPSTDNDCLDAGGSTFYYYHQDANYNVIALTNSSGNLVHRYLYDAYGRPHTYTVNSDGVSTAELLLPGLDADGDGGVDVYNPYLFTGREYDPETRLYHYRARAYHPQLGRFMQRDPKGEGPSTGFRPMDVYTYCGNKSTIRVDPSGLYATSTRCLLCCSLHEDIVPCPNDPWIYLRTETQKGDSWEQEDPSCPSGIAVCWFIEVYNIYGVPLCRHYYWKTSTRFGCQGCPASACPSDEFWEELGTSEERKVRADSDTTDYNCECKPPKNALGEDDEDCEEPTPVPEGPPPDDPIEMQ